MKVTIKEIAEKAGVHPATVDKVLHHRVGVSDEVRQKVQAIIDEMGYKPNPAGRILQKQGKEFRIAAILADVDAMPFLKSGIDRGVSEQVGFQIRIEYHITKFQDAQGQAAILDHAADNQVDGIIISPINSEIVRSAIDRATEAGIPVVTTDSDIDNAKRLCYVGVDSARASRVAGRLMGEFLRGAGQIAIISSAIAEENNNYGVATRQQGFTGFIQREFPGIEIVTCLESFEDAAITYQKTAEILREYPDLRGIYITCGGVSEVGRALRESGREQEVTVFSFESYPEILALMQQGVINCTLASDFQRQGMLPVKLIMDYLVFGTKPAQEQLFTEFRVLVKESL
ncbi:LacI family DNA-binding transcriptional regulator [Clostridiaceae bacterium]|nr:LacI family DNA-binding transcriptional regulator [Clostridiaceae bacterium]